MNKNFTSRPHWASQFVNVQCGRCGKNPAEIIIPPESFIVCVKCAAKQGIVLPAIQLISQVAAIKLFATRGIKTTRTTIYRWCRDGLLPAAWDGLADTWRPYRDGVENFVPPKRGNPQIHKLRRKVLRRKKK